MVALGNTVYAAKESKTPLSADELTQAKSTLEGVEKTSFTPKSGQSAADQAAEKRKIVSLANEILAAL